MQSVYIYFFSSIKYEKSFYIDLCQGSFQIALGVL